MSALEGVVRQPDNDELLEERDLLPDNPEAGPVYTNFTADRLHKPDEYNMLLSVEYVAPSMRKGARLLVKSGGLQRTYEYNRAAMDPYLEAAWFFAGGAADRVELVETQVGKRTYVIAPRTDDR
jgi:hypothetical protein